MLGAKQLIWWSYLTFEWSDLTFGRSDRTGSDLTMVRSNRNSKGQRKDSSPILPSYETPTQWGHINKVTSKTGIAGEANMNAKAKISKLTS